jgi:hypothetical protein
VPEVSRSNKSASHRNFVIFASISTRVLPRAARLLSI